MGIKERQERDRATVRRAILDAARDLFVSEGYGNVSIRKIAERIEYSPAALYSYFPSKDDIFFALANEGFDLLYRSPGEARNVSDSGKVDGPLGHLRDSLWRFYCFSCDHPQYFALMFLDRTVPRLSKADECLLSARQGKADLNAMIQACIDAGDLPATTPPSVAFRVLTVGLLGMAAIRLSDRLSEGEDADALARDLLDVTIAGLQSGVPLRSCVPAPSSGPPHSPSRRVQ